MRKCDLLASVRCDKTGRKEEGEKKKMERGHKSQGRKREEKGEV